MTKKRVKSAALLFMMEALKRHSGPEKVVTDCVRSYRVAMRDIGNS